MKHFLGRILDRISLNLRRILSAARVGITSFSTARTSVKFLLAVIAVVIPVGVFLLQGPSKAMTNVITVNTTDDPGTSSECSLRAAINNANNKGSDANSTCPAGTGLDIINFSVSGTITLGSTLPAIANTAGLSVAIDGTGQTITLNGANLYRVL